MATHLADPLTPANLWSTWSLEPWVLIPLVVITWLYLLGTYNIWRRAGMGRGISLRRFGGFVGAVVSLLVALISPLDALSGDLLWALPRPCAQKLGHGLNRPRILSRAWQVLSHPVSAWLLFAIPMWVWHAAKFYEAALRNETVHIFEHVSFTAMAMLFWWVLFRHSTANHRHLGMAVPYLFTTSLHRGNLGALMLFSSRPWYLYYANLGAPWGYTPLQDQQMGGLIMWIPGGLVFTLLTIGYFAAWLRAMEQRSARPQRRELLSTPQEPE